MKIGICDDEKDEGVKIKSIVESCIGNSKDCVIDLYDPYNLDFDIDAKRFDCDLLITDIKFNDCDFDGISMVSKINANFPCCKVIYLSDYLEYGPEVYETEHTWFVWKKNMKVMLKRAINKAIMQQEEDAKSDTIEFFSNGSKTFVRERDVMYVERVDRHINIVTNLRAYVCCLSLAALKAQFGENMVRAAGNYIVNLEYVRSIKGKEVEVESQKKITLGRKFEKPFKQAYLEYVARKM